MRIGVMIGPERGRYSTKVERLCADARGAEEAGLASAWIPQIPDEFDALTAVTLVGAGHVAPRDRHGGGADPDRGTPSRWPSRPCPCRPCAGAACPSASASRTTGSSRRCSACTTSAPPRRCAAYLDVLDQALRGPGPVDVENDYYRVHNPLDITDIAPTPVLLAALGPMMLRLAGERTDGTILWLADERAIAGHVAPHLNRAAEAAGRPTPRIVAGIPVCLCRDDEVDRAVERTNRILSEAEVSPNYQKLLDLGDARSVGDILAAGSEAAVEKRLRSFADAGVTDLSVRVVPIGQGRDELLASSQRTRALLASLASAF